MGQDSTRLEHSTATMHVRKAGSSRLAHPHTCYLLPCPLDLVYALFLLTSRSYYSILDLSFSLSFSRALLRTFHVCTPPTRTSESRAFPRFPCFHLRATRLTSKHR
eukprot:4979689-Pleurochrysis_carterae.AAC.4